jgi:hypothetical protein
MKVLRLNEVLMRVVAWHNCHPLARRINASQVHSIGEVLLPFAASEPAPVPTRPAAVASLPDVADLLDPPQTLTALLPDAHGPAAPALAAQTLRPLPDAAAPAASPDDDDLRPSMTAEAPPAATPEVDADADASPFTLAEADLAAGLVAELNDPASAQADAAHPGLDLTLPLAPQAASSRSAAPLPTPHAAARASAVGTPTSRLKRLLARLTGRQSGMPRLQATFSRDFIWPLSPRQVAGWARSHGQLQPLAPADWPRRVVETDGTLLNAARQKGLAHAVELHLLTAAIGVGDRRLRVLMDAQGTVIGPRAYSRPRLAVTGGMLALALFGLGWTTLRPRLPERSALLAAAAATGAPAASVPSVASVASAASAASAASVATSVPEAVAVPVSDPAEAAASSALMTAAAASTSGAAASPDGHAGADANAAAVAPALEAAAPPAEARHTGPANLLARASAPASPLATAPTQRMAAEAAANTAAPLGHIRPSLSDEDKQAARAQTAALREASAAVPRAAAAASAPSTVYAVVTRPSPQREVARAGLTAMRRASGRLPPPVPEHGELMQSQGAWRAAWWPFASLADAERARVLLAGKGLKVEVIEF